MSINLKIKAPTKKFSRTPLKTVIRKASVSSANPESISYYIKKKFDRSKSSHPLSVFYDDDDDKYPYKPATSREVSDLIHGRETEEDMNPFKNALKKFTTLSENSPMEAPVAGFNRHLRYMSPTTRDMVLQSRMPDIMAFAEDRQIDAGIVAGIAEASMRLGRIPDLGMYGLSGDDALAVKHFIADNVLNLAEEIEANGSEFLEDANGENPKAKHLKLASDYKKLAEFHKRRSKEELDKGKIAKEDGRAHSAIKANAAAEEHKTLAAHCMGLSDYHQIKSNEHPGIDMVKPPQYPAQDPKKAPEEPQEERPEEKVDNTKGPKDEEPKVESTTSNSFAKSILEPSGGAFPKPAQSIMPRNISMIERSPVTTKYTRWGQDKEMYSGKKLSGQNYNTKQVPDEAERPSDKRKAMESRIPHEPLLDEILMEAKKKKVKKQAFEKMKHVLANAKTAPLFQELGHKMDKAEVKAGLKPSNWAKNLHQKCLKSGGSVASDAVISHSLNNPWVRDQGFSDESSNLRRHWETAMSDDAQKHAAEVAPFAPEPLVLAVNKIKKMSSK